MPTKNGLPCTNVCRECHDVSCTNSQLPDLSNAYDDDGWVGPSPTVYQLQWSITVLTISSSCVTFRIYVDECVTKVWCGVYTWKCWSALITLVDNFILWNMSYISANIW